MDAIYGVLWVRLLIGHRKLNGRVIDQILDIAWRGLAHRRSLLASSRQCVRDVSYRLNDSAIQGSRGPETPLRRAL